MYLIGNQARFSRNHFNVINNLLFTSCHRELVTVIYTSSTAASSDSVNNSDGLKRWEYKYQHYVQYVFWTKL